MNEEQRQEQGGDDGDFEERLRELLAEDAYRILPSSAPYPAIRRQGVVEYRRRMTVAGAAMVMLAAVPAGAIALTSGPARGDTATPTPSATTTRLTTPTPTPTPSASPSGPEAPATAGQLLDGVTYDKAAAWLEDCLAYSGRYSTLDDQDMGDAADYKILLGMRSTGDTNSPGDGFYVYAVREDSSFKMLCHIKDDEVSGISSGSIDEQPDAGHVQTDPNDYKLYQQSFLDKGNWKLPFRWGSIGLVDSEVAKVTVSYGDSTSQAVLDDGYFVASGILNEQVTKNPHIKGYDADGKLIYDSDEDSYYAPTIP